MVVQKLGMDADRDVVQLELVAVVNYRSQQMINDRGSFMTGLNFNISCSGVTSGTLVDE